MGHKSSSKDKKSSSHSSSPSSSSKKEEKRKDPSSSSYKYAQQYVMDPQTHEMVAVGLRSGRIDGQQMVEEWDQSWEAASRS
ncbi:hypothetical protein SUNI508_00808 [Seiridium unicorne]|uniref:Uncharacterized protein n=1 Tax=Seiridium unicorne TaxID=138068 RepID=A0ABR2V1J8_9PEZI